MLSNVVVREARHREAADRHFPRNTHARAPVLGYHPGMRQKRFCGARTRRHLGGIRSPLDAVRAAIVAERRHG
jgi:hypothetical protein